MAQALSGGAPDGGPPVPPVMVIRLTGLSLTNGYTISITGTYPVIFFVAGNVLVDSGASIRADATGNSPGGGGDSAECGTSTGHE